MWFASRRRMSTPSPTPATGTTRRTATAPIRLRLEALDDRLVPAQVSLTVSTLADAGAGSLRAAILAADAGTHSDKFTIDIAVSGTIDLQSSLPHLTHAIAIQGPGADRLTVERAAGASFDEAIVYVEFGQTASLSGLTIANGNHGGILNEGILAVSGCTISGNSAYGPGTFFGAGGGIFNRGTLTLTGSTVSGNTAYAAGGIENDGTLTVSDSILSGNSAQTYGGGIFNAGTATVRGSSLSGNTAGTEGGGIYNGEIGKLSIKDSSLTDNDAQTGRDLYNAGVVHVSGSTIGDRYDV
jgi:hypothetical protein